LKVKNNEELKKTLWNEERVFVYNIRHSMSKVLQLHLWFPNCDPRYS